MSILGGDMSIVGNRYPCCNGKGSLREVEDVQSRRCAQCGKRWDVVVMPAGDLVDRYGPDTKRAIWTEAAPKNTRVNK
jgi:hypothetical protein